MELPHAGPPRGHRYTRLQEPTFVYCYWTGNMRTADIADLERDVVGTVHEVQLEQILAILNKLSAEQGLTP